MAGVTPRPLALSYARRSAAAPASYTSTGWTNIGRYSFPRRVSIRLSAHGRVRAGDPAHQERGHVRLLPHGEVVPEDDRDLRRELHRPITSMCASSPLSRDSHGVLAPFLALPQAPLTRARHGGHVHQRREVNRWTAK